MSARVRASAIVAAPPARRGLVIVAVMVVAGIGLLIASTLLLLTRAETSGAARAAAAAQSRALAWSGVQAVAVELGRQRDRMLGGEAPELEDQYVIEEGGGRLGVVRLLPIAADGATLVSESARFDLAEATVEGLQESGLADAALARAVIAARTAASNRLDAVEGLLAASKGAVTAVDLHGDLEAIDLRAAVAGEEGDRGERILGRLEGGAPRGLAELLTVHACEPAVDADGAPRVLVRPPWSEEMGEAVAARLGSSAAEILRVLLEGGLVIEGRRIDDGLTLDRDRHLAEVLIRAGSPIEDWVRPIDILTFEPEPVRVGRLDLNTASAAAIAMLPGVSMEEAAAIVEARDSLSAEERRTIMWPALREIWPLERYPDLVERITVRSFVWRVRLACGSVSEEEPDGPIEDATLWEVVIDASAARPRLSALREITEFDLVARLVAARTEARDFELEDPEPLDEPDPPRAAAARPEWLDPTPTVETGPPEPPARERNRGRGATRGASESGSARSDRQTGRTGRSGSRRGGESASGRGGRSSDSSSTGGSGGSRGPIGRWRPLS